MADAPLALVLRHLRRLAHPPAGAGPRDGELLQEFTARRDEAAFQELLGRHGPMVLGVCRRVLRDDHDAEDAFQATFLLLAQKAGSIRKQDSVGSWLHGVAHRLALKARSRQGRLRTGAAPDLPGTESDPARNAAWGELREILDEEFRRLPTKYRDVLVLCYLEGKTHEEAAAALGRPLGTVKSLLARGRDLLRGRLTRRGLALSAAGFATVLVASQASAAVPAALAAATVRAAVLSAAGPAAVPATVAPLLEGMTTTMSTTRAKLLAALLGLACLLGAGASLLAYHALTGRTPEIADQGEPQVDQSPAVPAVPGEGPLPAGALLRLGGTRLRHQEGLHGVAFAPDGKALATGGGDHRVRFWDPATGRALQTLTIDDGPIGALAYAPGGKTLAVTAGTSVRLYDPATGKEVRKLALAGQARQLDPVTFSPDGTLVAAVAWDDWSVHVWDTATGKERLQRPLPGLEPGCLAFTADGKSLLAAIWQKDGTFLHQWDLTTGKEVRSQVIASTGAQRLRPMAFSPGGTSLAVERVAQKRRPLPAGGIQVSSEYQVVLVDPVTGKERHRLEGQDDVIWAVAFSADGKTVAWNGMDYRAGVADVETGKVLWHLQGPPGCARPDGRSTLAFSADGSMLAAVGDGAAAEVWDLASGREAFDLSVGHRGAVTDLAFAPDGRTLASASADRTVRLWDPATGAQRRVLQGHPADVRAVAFAPDGATLASASQQSDVRLWDPATGALRHEIQAVKQDAGVYFGLSPLAFTPDGKVLLTWGDDRRLHRCDVATGKELARPEPVLAGLPPAPDGRPKEMPDFTNQVQAVAFRPDGRMAAVVVGSSLYLGDTRTGHQLFRVPGPGTPCRLAFSPDGQLLVGGGWDKAVSLWEVATAKEVLTIKGLDFVNAVAFAPDGRSVAAATGWLDGRIHVFDVATGSERQRFSGHRAYVAALAFAPDGKALASGQRDGTILLWGLSPPREEPARAAVDVDRLWADLTGDDARQAHAALWTLVGTPEQAVPFLRAHLRPTEATAPGHIRRLIGDLDSATFAVRAAAEKELRRLGDEAEPLLRQALKDSPSPEARKRLEAVLAGPPTGEAPPPEVLRRLRAVRVLEQIGSPEARGILEALAGGAPAAVDTRAAAGALQRLKPHADSGR